jgi:protein arginine N-methyltransferase 7
LQIDLVFAEPFFTTAYLPWHNVRLWYRIQKLRDLGVVSKKATFLPATAKIHAMAVEFKDLWKIRSPLGKVLDLDVREFDELIEVVVQFLPKCIFSFHRLV